MGERRKYTSELRNRLLERRKRIQVLVGARQVGKTTILDDVINSISIQTIYESADDILAPADSWLYNLWQRARQLIATGCEEVLLVIDEIQKIKLWNEIVKKLWDEDTMAKRNIKVVLSGSARILLEKGLGDSLEGRFEAIHVPHWYYGEKKDTFGTTLDEYIFYGSYPGAVDLINQPRRWRLYIRDSIIEASIKKDITNLTTILKPALLEQLVQIAGSYSGQILSYNHMLGQFNDAGNTTTLAWYLELLDQSGLVGGLQKYSGSLIREKSSSPKLQVHNNAIMSALGRHSLESAKNESEIWGHYVESAVGAHLVNHAFEDDYEVLYWREKNDEIDFVINASGAIAAFEVKSGGRFIGKGQRAFCHRFPNAKCYTVSYQEEDGGYAIPIEEFLLSDPLDYL